MSASAPPGGISFASSRASAFSLHESKGEQLRPLAGAGRRDTLRSAEQDNPALQARPAPKDQESSCISCIGSFFVSCWDVIASFFTSLFSCFCSKSDGGRPPSAERVALDAFLRTEKPAREAPIRLVEAYVAKWRETFASETEGHVDQKNANYRLWKAELQDRELLPQVAYDYALTLHRSMQRDEARKEIERAKGEMAQSTNYNNVLDNLTQWARNRRSEVVEQEAGLVQAEKEQRLLDPYMNVIKPFMEKWAYSFAVRNDEPRFAQWKLDVTALLNSDLPEGLKEGIYDAGYKAALIPFGGIDNIPSRLRDENGNIDKVRMFEHAVLSQGITSPVMDYLEGWERASVPDRINLAWYLRKRELQEQATDSI